MPTYRIRATYADGTGHGYSSQTYTNRATALRAARRLRATGGVSAATVEETPAQDRTS
jgi:hypothetical protein